MHGPNLWALGPGPKFGGLGFCPKFWLSEENPFPYALFLPRLSESIAVSVALISEGTLLFPNLSMRVQPASDWSANFMSDIL